MILTTWPCPHTDAASMDARLPNTSANTGYAPEMALAFTPGDSNQPACGTRLLILPALFDEANRLRRFTVATMRQLASLGIASVLPDLPGCGESLWPLEAQDLTRWRAAAMAATAHFNTSHVLTIRGGVCLAPPGLPGWHYAPQAASAQLRQLLRARTLASREAGHSETPETLLAHGRTHGLDLAGYPLGPAMLAQLHAEPTTTNLPVIPQSALGAPGLWLRAEPGEDAAQATTLATIIATALGENRAQPRVAAQ